MTPPTIDADGPTTEEAFQNQLRRLVRTADANGVDVEGGWTCRTDDGRSDWGVEILELQSRAPTADRR
jgi:hypothetical protein